MSWFTWPIRLLGFVAWYAWQVLSSNLAVLRDNLTPGQASTTGIARFPTRCRSDAEITLLGALITLTPGTLTLGTDIEDDGKRVLFVHGLYAADAEALRDELDRMETRLLRALRRRGVSS